MSLFVIVLILASAFFHVLWNLLAKSNSNKEHFAWITTIGATSFLGLICLFGQFYQPSSMILNHHIALGFISALFQAIYMILLFRAYALIDLSVVYPVSRGLAPILIMLVAAYFVGDSVTTLQGVGVVASALGAIAVGMTSRNQQGRFCLLGLLFCLLVSAMTAGYIIVDRKVMVDTQAARPVDYLFMVYFFQSVLLSLWLGIKRRGLPSISALLKADTKNILLVSLCIPLCHICVLIALQYGNATLVSAGRNVGILLSVLAGHLWLREKVSLGRTFGAVTIFVGLICIALH